MLVKAVYLPSRLFCAKLIHCPILKELSVESKWRGALAVPCVAARREAGRALADAIMREPASQA